MTGAQSSFGWTEDPAILAVFDALNGTEDHRLLENRKDGGVHCVWLYPLGSFWDDDGDHDNPEPIFTRVDVSWGRYLKSGVTFLVWEDESVRAGTLEDAQWMLKGVRGETRRTAQRLERQIREDAARQLRAQSRQFLTITNSRGVPLGGVDFAALLPGRDP